jgi:hypothetical protein
MTRFNPVQSFGTTVVLDLRTLGLMRSGRLLFSWTFNRLSRDSPSLGCFPFLPIDQGRRENEIYEEILAEPNDPILE